MKKQADEIAAATAAAEAAGDAEAAALAKAGRPERELYWVDVPDKVGIIFLHLTPAAPLSALHELARTVLS